MRADDIRPRGLWRDQHGVMRTAEGGYVSDGCDDYDRRAVMAKGEKQAAKPARRERAAKDASVALWEGRAPGVGFRDKPGLLLRVFDDEVRCVVDGEEREWVASWRETAKLTAHLARLLKADDQSNEGAQAERDAVRKYLRRVRAGRPSDGVGLCEVALLDRILRWLDGRTARFAARPGGLKGPGRPARRGGSENAKAAEGR